MVDYLNALGNKTECNSSKISHGCNLPQTYVLHHSFQQNVTNWRGNRIDQNRMDNDAFQQNAGFGGILGGSFWQLLKKKKKSKISPLFFHLICACSFANIHVELCAAHNPSKSNANRLKLYVFSSSAPSPPSARLCGSPVEQLWRALRGGGQSPLELSCGSMPGSTR